MTDTIFAPATPPGRSGIAVVRVSGPLAWKSLHRLSRRKLAPGQAKLCALRNPATKEIIDRAVVVFFKSPASFTGEDVVEYHIHGGHAVLNELLGVLAAQPEHRLAEPGEFTRRAFENGKMDLTGAEAIADLINAETQAQKAQALAQMEGSLSRLYQGWTDTLKKDLAHIEADLEFPDEDLPQGIAPKLRPAIEGLMGEITVHLDDNRRGERLREGIQVAVIGAPNAGKSSLVNALAQRDIAIVSDFPGTTRDVIEAHLDLGGYPVTLADTAGLRPETLRGDGQEGVESEGIRRALKRAQEADIKILLFDSTSREADQATAALADNRSVIAFNKADIFPRLNFPRASEHLRAHEIILVSAKTGYGIDRLLAALLEKIKPLAGFSETPSLTRQRHRQALEECRQCLARVLGAKLPELMAEDLRLAVRALGRITGRVDVEDLLDVIFRDFCIGK